MLLIRYIDLFTDVGYMMHLNGR